MSAMSPYKALRSDGYQPLFYQKFWDIVGAGTTSAELKCSNNELLPSEMNQSLLVLIPKVDRPENIKQFRPTSLCNVIYKAITKAIVNRLKPLLPQIVSPNQTSFIPGRTMSDNILIYQEVLHTFRNKKGRKGFMMLKLDLEKAYDHLDWNFIQDTLTGLG